MYHIEGRRRLPEAARQVGPVLAEVIVRPTRQLLLVGKLCCWPLSQRPSGLEIGPRPRIEWCDRVIESVLRHDMTVRVRC
eukprot:scaffold418_cov386-Prasinococcus_capsulatus_cf.AAC.29